MSKTSPPVFGNGIPIDRLRAEARATTFDTFRERYGEYFLVVHIHDVAAAAADTAKAKTKAGSTVKGNASPPTPPPLAPTAVFPMKKKAKSTPSTMDWIAVGRNEANDVFLPHASISRIHAFFRDMGSTMMLQDARSSNGTFLGDVPVPSHGDGQPLPMTPGNTVRFGDVVATFLNAEGLFAILTKLAEAP